MVWNGTDIGCLPTKWSSLRYVSEDNSCTSKSSCVCVCHVCVCVCVCIGGPPCISLSLRHSPLCCLKQNLSLETGAHQISRSSWPVTPGDPSHAQPWDWITDDCHHTLHFLMGSGHQTQVPCLRDKYFMPDLLSSVAALLVGTAVQSKHSCARFQVASGNQG